VKEREREKERGMEMVMGPLVMGMVKGTVKLAWGLERETGGMGLCNLGPMLCR
jgi:hypothetical protein